SCAVVEQSDEFHTQVPAKRLLQLLVHRATIGQCLAAPDLLQIRNELLQRWQEGLGDVDRVRLGSEVRHGRLCGVLGVGSIPSCTCAILYSTSIARGMNEG